MDLSPGPMTIPKIKFGDLELLSMKETKFLGINLNNNLSWDTTSISCITNYYWIKDC